ncbi:MAG: response regulator [Polyangiaceae bacterium]
MSVEAERTPAASSREGERLVLIVEDEPVLRASMARGLSKLSSVEVVVAGNVAEGRKLLSALSPKVLILDLHLPDGSGLDLLSEIDPARSRMAAILVTAYPQRLDSRSLRRRDVPVLEKPVPMVLLRSTVIRALDTLGEKEAGSPFCVADYLQLASYARRTVRLDVYRKGERAGRIWVRDGEGYHAEDTRGDGRHAFQRLLRLTDTRIECCSVTGDPGVARTLSGTCEELLLESTRFLDESRRDGVDPDEADRALEAMPSEESLAAAIEPTEDDGSNGEGAFEKHYSRGVEALLSRQYETAYVSFVAASRFGSTTGLDANLNRLRAMGYGQ